jgi:hypothetical protein
MNTHTQMVYREFIDGRYRTKSDFFYRFFSTSESEVLLSEGE